MTRQIKTIIKSIPWLHFLLKKPYERFKYNKLKLWYYGNMTSAKYPKVLKRWYIRYTGEVLDLENPKTYNEKIQWLKLYDSTPEKTMLADKFQVREWVTEKIGEDILIPLLGVWENADDIDFDKLPYQFVLKANHGCGWNIIVKDKSKLNIKKTKKQLDYWLKHNFAFATGFELHYKDIPPVIMAEKYIENMDNELYDYKFLCFDGELKYYWIDAGRNTNHRRTIFDMYGEAQPFQQHTYPKIIPPPKPPPNFDKMVEFAQILCKGFKHVRIDFYNIDGKIYFGEMTFTNSSGTEKIHPQEYAKLLGDMIKLH